MASNTLVPFPLPTGPVEDPLPKLTTYPQGWLFVCTVTETLAPTPAGFGLAVMPDFRVVCPEARFTANFVKLGFHPGFGLTHTLPRLIGHQKAHLLFLTGRRIGGEQAHEWGLADVLTSQDKLRDEAIKLASEIAENAPLAVESVRATMRAGLSDAVKKQTDHEFLEQFRLQKTEDHKEGVKSVAERRPGNFVGR